MTNWHCSVAVSLDGKLARLDGSVEDWLAEDYPPDEKFEAFLAEVDGILMGRDTYDVIRRVGDWPYPGKPAIVMTSRPLTDAPPLVEARAGDLAPVAAELESRGYAPVWIEGGGKLLRGMMSIGKVDVLEMMVIPIILGDGIPLFPQGVPEARLSLERARPWIKDALHLVYRVNRNHDP